MEATKTLGSVGAALGIYYGMTKQKGFWITAGLVALFAIGGAALGSVYESTKK